MGRLETIWVKRGSRAPMDAVADATLEEGVGVVGNADVGGARQVTIVDRARWAEACRTLGVDLDPALRRANLLVDGVELEGSRGRALRVGAAVVRIRGETVPCRLMDEQHRGLQEALRPRWGGGAYGTVERGGTVRVGDAVDWLEE